jgi:hypothetical protein
VRWPAVALPAEAGATSWRALVSDTRSVEAQVLSHQDFPVDDLRQYLGVIGPSFETLFDPTGDPGGGLTAISTPARTGWDEPCWRGDCSARVSSPW